jgi:thiamine-phosphate pyrophosphorylase
VGADDLPVEAVRRVLGPAAVVGATCRNPADARAAVAAGATYLGVGPAFATTSKSGLPEPIGVAGVAAVVRAVPGTPVIAIAGITPERVALLDSYGVAAISAVSTDPAGATVALLSALDARWGSHATAGSATGGSLAGRVVAADSGAGIGGAGIGDGGGVAR